MTSENQTPPPESLDREETKPFLDHLEDLRRTIISCLVTLVIAVVIALPLSRLTLSVLTLPLVKIGQDPGQFLRTLKVAGAFTVTLRIAAWSGLLFSAPFLIYFIWRFVMPGLTRRERDLARKSFGFAFILFFLGVALGYFVCLPIALEMMLRIHDWLQVSAEWTVNDYVAFSTQMLIGFGLAFELPIVVLVLGKLGIVTVEQLSSRRRHVIVVCLVVGMLMTPADISSQIIMAGPLYILFELCLLILRWDQRKARKLEEESEGAAEEKSETRISKSED